MYAKKKLTNLEQNFFYMLKFYARPGPATRGEQNWRWNLFISAKDIALYYTDKLYSSNT